MQILITFVIIILLAVVSYRINNPLMRSMVKVFLLFWGVVLLISTFNPYNLDEVSMDTYFLLLLYVSSFTIGTLLPKRNASSYYSVSINMNFWVDRIIINKIFLLFIVFLDAIVLFLYLRTQALLAMYDVAEMRADLDSILYQGNSFLALTKNMIINPLTPILTFLGAYILFYNRKKILPLILVGVFVILSALIEGSRSGILRIAIYCFFMLLCRPIFTGEKMKFSFKSFLLFIPIIAVVLIIMSNMTAQREFNLTGFSWENALLGMDSLFKHFVTYCVGPFRALEYSFDADYLSKIGGYKLGGCTMGFIDGMLSLVLGIMGFNYIPASRGLTTLLQDNWINIGGFGFNFAYTAVIFHYMDFGILGVIILPMIWGYIVGVFANKFYKTKNPILLILLAYMFTVMLNSIFTWRLYRHVAFMTFFLVFILYKWYKRKYGKKLRNMV